MFSGNLKTAVQNLRLSKWRTIFTMLGIIIGISSVVTVVSLGEGLKHQIVGQISQLGSNVLTVRSGKLVSHSRSSNLSLLGFFNTSVLGDQDIAALNRLQSVSDISPMDFVTNSASLAGKELNNISVIG